MAGWDWLTMPVAGYNWRFMGRVVAKAVVLFVLFNLLFALVTPLPALGRVSLYNVVVPGRERLPYGEDPAQSYNLNINSLDAMFASHEIARPKAADEYRVLLMGDSSTWGWLLKPSETLASALNAAELKAANGKRIVVYNLGYPIMSLTKDLLLLDYALRDYQPDMVVWAFTLESFPRDKQVYPPIVQNNAAAVRPLIDTYHLDLDPNDSRFVNSTFLDQTLVGRRRELADWLRLQLYGIPWAVTGIDQYYPPSYTPRTEDFENDPSWQDYKTPQPLTEKELAFDVLKAGIARVGNLPILLINEPMFISAGKNSDVRYNFFYPRWAYDAYHALLTKTAADNGWNFLDLWDIMPGTEFTDSPVHLTPKGVLLLRDRVAPALTGSAH